MAGRRVHTPPERHRALQIFALNHGRPDLTRKMLDENGISVHTDTLRRWTKEDPDTYARVRREVEEEIRDNHIDGFRENVSRAIDVTREALRQAQDLLARGEADPKELLKIAQLGSITAGISTDKSELLAGRPTQIVDNVNDTGDLIRSLGSVGISVIVAGRPLSSDPNQPNHPVVEVREKQPDALPEAVEGRDAVKSEVA